MTTKQLIIASTHPFMADMRFGTAYLAEALCELGWDILYIEQPTSPLHLIHHRARDRAWNKAVGAFRAFSDKTQTYRLGDGRLTLLQTIVPWPHINLPLMRGEFILDYWWKFAFPRIQGVLKQIGLTNPQAMLIDSPYFYSLAQHLKLHTLYRYADRIQYFSEITPALLKKQHVALQSTDIVLYTSNAMLDDLSERTKPVHYLPNGVNTAPFKKAYEEPVELATIAKPRIIYSGTLGPWLDTTALRTAALALPDLQFVLLGKSSVEHPSLANIANIHFLGTVPHYQVPAFLQHSDVGVIPFDIVNQREFVAAINPLKLYEYCAAGLPVVSYVSDETKKAGDLINYYTTPEEFISAIRATLTCADIDAGKRRKEWADTMSWYSRGTVLQDLICSIRNESSS